MRKTARSTFHCSHMVVVKAKKHVRSCVCGTIGEGKLVCSVCVHLSGLDALFFFSGWPASCDYSIRPHRREKREEEWSEL